MAILEIIATSVVTVAVGQGALMLKERWSESREAKFSALYLSLFLEEYGRECAHRYGEREVNVASQGAAGNYWTSLPPLADFPSEIHWKQVGIDFTEKAFSFRVEVASGEAMISSAYDADDDLGNGQVSEELLVRGIAAFELATTIRNAKRLSSPPSVYEHYNPHRYLVDERESRKERSRRQQEARIAPVV
jgi:hypothetical protein